ncbi:MAG: alpha-ketoglutarate-dependent dioxygenase AlkB [Gammaproteobacteria bacterium]|jgi:alkylated DNA repair dioxygenase AlkB
MPVVSESRQSRTLINRNGRLDLISGLIPHDEANRLFAVLQSKLAWSEEHIKVYGKFHKVPRLVCWYGDNNVNYRYSGVDHQALPWPPALQALRQRVQQVTGEKFNSVLGNLYRNGQDSMGWHADNEKELGDSPFIASISLGEERIFKVRHKDGETIKLALPHGSLLTMSGAFQQYWQHCIPKTSRPRAARINLTFRNIVGK